jgi:anaerobic nitric oxide reductase flavorubredoxin
MKPLEIKKNVFWVGAIDWAVRDFHGYSIPDGTTYNNYLVIDRDVTLFDTVKLDFASETVQQIKSLTDFSKIKNIVINHIEPDHASSLDILVDKCPGVELYMTDKAKTGLARVFDITNWKINTVKTGDRLNIGEKELLFIETTMMHWPDSMVTYIPQDKLLISQDAFGQHFASACRFDDEFIKTYSKEKLEDAVLDYYANILMPFGGIIRKKLDDIKNLGLEIDMIAPDHGVIWRQDAAGIMKRYHEMAGGAAEEGVCIVYDTMWGSTEAMVEPIAMGVMAEGLPCRVVKLRSSPMSAAITEFWRMRGTIIGTPTVNNLMFPSVAQFLHHLRGLRPKNRLMAAFGSHGWSGGGAREAYEEFGKMGLPVLEPCLECRYRPSVDDRDASFNFGREFAKKVKEMQGEI